MSDFLLAQFATNPVTGNIRFAGSFGNIFDVVSPIQVTGLGGLVDSAGWTSSKVFRVSRYSDQVDVVGPITVSVADLAGATTLGIFKIKAISPVTVPAGRYMVWVDDYGSTDSWFIGGGSPSPVPNTGGGLVSFPGLSPQLGSPGAWPSAPSGGSDPFIYAGPNLTFRAPVAAPAAHALTLTGVGA